MAANDSKNNRKLKLLYLMDMLQNKTDSTRGLTMFEIIANLEELGISAERKSIYRDIDALKEFGINVVTFPRSPVEYAIVRDDLSIDELMLLVDAVQGCKFLSESKSNSLVRSIKSLASEGERKRLNKRVHVEGRVKSQNDSVFHNVDVIHQAMNERCKISFLYYKYGPNMESKIQHGGKPYVHTPVRLEYTDGFYYLITWSDSAQDFVTFRVDRMKLLQLTDEPATRNELIANYGNEASRAFSFGMFHGEAQSVVLHVSDKAMDVIVDRFGRDVVRTNVTEEGADVHVNVVKSAQFFGWVAGLDGSIKIVGPQSVVDEYRDWLLSLMNG